MSAETVQAYASVAGLVVATIGILFVVTQIRELQRSIRSGAHSAIYSQAASVREHLVAYPHLRKYFFEGAEISPDHHEHDRVASIAELYLNYLEHVAVMMDSFGRHNRTSLDRFIGHALKSSPILRRRLEDSNAAYSDALLGYLHRAGP